MRNIFYLICKAVNRSKFYIFSIFITYCISCTVGIIMSNNGNDSALSYRDKLVGKAIKSDKASINYHKGNNFSAAIIDFSGNLFLGAIPQTLMGLGIVVPYFTVAKQGWVGGIVSVDSEHKSRLNSFIPAFYYFFILLLQFIPYSLAIGAGIKCGIDFYNYNRMNGWMLWKYRIQKTSLVDLGLVYILVVPLFFLASCFEFMSKWNM